MYGMGFDGDDDALDVLAAAALDAEIVLDDLEQLVERPPVKAVAPLELRLRQATHVLCPRELLHLLLLASWALATLLGEQCGGRGRAGRV